MLNILFFLNSKVFEITKTLEVIYMKISGNCLDIKYNKNGDLAYVKGSGTRVKIPLLDKNLALFLGILWGDGWLANRKVALKNYSWRVGIVEDDKPLIYRFIELTNEVFGITPKINNRITKLEAYFSNRIVYEILNNIYNFPDGDKINKLKIPIQVLESDELTKQFLSGLFSTDGKFIIIKKNYPRIGLDSASLEFIKEVELALIRLKFNPRFSTWNRKKGNKLYALYLNGFKQARLFHKEIDFIGEKANKLEHFLANNAPLRPIAP